MRLATHRRMAFSTLLLAGMAVPAPARSQTTAETTRECAGNFEEGQRLRQNGKITAASDALMACSQSSCPQFISRECAKLYDEAQASMPSITVSATDGLGRTLTKVTVYLDGELFKNELDGRATNMDPGMHEFRFERAGSEPVTINVLVSEGEKNKLVTAQLPGEEAKEKPVELVSVAPIATPAPSPKTKPGSLVPPFVAGGLGLVAVGVGTYYHFAANSDYDDAYQSCRPNCGDKQIDSIESKYLVSEVAWGVGGAALITSAVLFLIRDGGSESEQPQVGLQWMPTGNRGVGFASYRGAF